MQNYPHYQAYLDQLNHAQMSYAVIAVLCCIAVLWIIYIRRWAPRFMPVVRWGSLIAVGLLIAVLAVVK